MPITSEKIFIDQSIESIRFCLLNKPIDEKQFTILETMSQQWYDYSVDVKILGESHMVTVSGKNGFIQEICACTDIDANQTSVIHKDYLRTFQQPIIHRSQRLGYSFYVQFGKISQLKLQLESLVKQIQNPDVATLHHWFAAHPDFSETDPLTLVLLEPESTLTVRSIHTYPNEDRLVFTKSLITEIDIS